MPVGDCQRAFARRAAADGIQLVPQRFPWICQRGHLALPDEAGEAATPLQEIFVMLGGDLDELAAGRLTSLPGDFLHEPTGTLIEIDERQHFTSFRDTTLALYPKDTALGFDLDTYRRLCRAHSPAADRYRASKAARCFGPGGRQRQRAYYDALRDLSAPAMGHPPLIRVEATDNDGDSAYERHLKLLHEALFR